VSGSWTRAKRDVAWAAALDALTALRPKLEDAASAMGVPVEWALCGAVEAALANDDASINDFVCAVETWRDTQIARMPAEPTS
jgi:hypothetical protein